MKNFLFNILLMGLSVSVYSQTVTTAVPFLTVNPDVRSAGLGNTGVAARPDAWAAFSNAARYAFTESKGGAVFSYTPWMKELVDGQNLFALAGFYKIDSKSAVSLGARYFTLPEFSFWNENGEITGTTSPADYAIDLAYSRRFGRHFAAALAVRYIHSGVGDVPDGVELEADGAVAGDVSLYYASDMKCGKYSGNWQVGLQLADLGSKISSYGADAYLPATLKLGGNAGLKVGEKHEVGLSLEFSRLLVEGNTAFKDNSVISNIFGSFGNRAFFKSVAWAVGGEYEWKKMVAGRIGYYHESEEYGDRCYFTLGAGGRWHGFLIDASYLIPAGDSDAPYKNTWRLGIGYCF